MARYLDNPDLKESPLITAIMLIASKIETIIELLKKIANFPPVKDAINKVIDYFRGVQEELKKLGEEVEKIRMEKEQLQLNYGKLQNEQNELGKEFDRMKAEKGQLQLNYDKQRKEYAEIKAAHESLIKKHAARRNYLIGASSCLCLAFIYILATR